MAAGGNQMDPKLREELMIEEQRAKFQLQVLNFTDTCWDKCIDKPGNKLDGRTESCLVNCVDRFIDTTLLISKRFSDLIQRSGGGF